MPGKPKGLPKTGGRKKGTPNRITRTAKEAYAYAFDALGGAERLHEWAQSDPNNLREFYRLHARLIPIEMTGKDGTDLMPSTIRIELVAPDE